MPKIISISILSDNTHLIVRSKQTLQTLGTKLTFVLGHLETQLFA